MGDLYSKGVGADARYLGRATPEVVATRVAIGWVVKVVFALAAVRTLAK